MTLLLKNPFGQSSLVLIEDDVLAPLTDHRQLSPIDTEAGGILIGYRRGPHVHVVEATLPASGDIRSRYEFNRIDGHHAQHADRRWRSSRHKLDCVGEWHTHPENHPAPSSLDLTEWRRVLQSANRPMVFAIVGLRSNWVGVGEKRTVREAASSA